MPDDVEPLSSVAARPTVRPAAPRPLQQATPTITERPATTAQSALQTPEYASIPPTLPQQAPTDPTARVPARNWPPRTTARSLARTVPRRCGGSI